MTRGLLCQNALAVERMTAMNDGGNVHLVAVVDGLPRELVLSTVPAAALARDLSAAVERAQAHNRDQ